MALSSEDRKCMHTPSHKARRIANRYLELVLPSSRSVALLPSTP